jgi:hypothetical protein
MAPFFLSSHYMKAGDVQSSISAIELRLERRRTVLALHYQAITHRVRQILSSPQSYFLAFGTGFVIAQLVGTRTPHKKDAEVARAGKISMLTQIFWPAITRLVGEFVARQISSPEQPRGEAPSTP